MSDRERAVEAANEYRELSGKAADVLSGGLSFDTFTYRGSLIHDLCEVARAMQKYILSLPADADREAFVRKCMNAGYHACENKRDIHEADVHRYATELAAFPRARPDEGEPVTDVMLPDFGFKPMGPQGAFILANELALGTKAIIQSTSDVALWIYQDGSDDHDAEGAGTSYIPKPKTRGQLRRLLESLNIQPAGEK